VSVQLNIDQSLHPVISDESRSRAEMIHPHAADEMLYPEMEHP